MDLSLANFANIGSTSSSGSSPAVASTRKNVARIEQRIMLDKLTGRGVEDAEDYTW